VTFAAAASLWDARYNYDKRLSDTLAAG